ncbi:MAG TPA: hypothetical protein VNF75_05530 [Candidatus Dormibacteraeota bacterium]|nr:hypothetical protein [Candidatus Dormibacteraeota bacterium]
MPGPGILVDSWLGAEAPGPDALSGGMVAIRGEPAMRAMRPVIATAQSLRGGVVAQPTPTHRGQMAEVPRAGTVTTAQPALAPRWRRASWNWPRTEAEMRALTLRPRAGSRVASSST